MFFYIYFKLFFSIISEFLVKNTAPLAIFISFGKIFDAVEKHNWVPEYIPTDEDMYDKLLNQFSNIERSL